MVQAMYQVTIIYDHIPGRLNVLANSLSRAHISKRHLDQARHLVNTLGLAWIDPCLHSITVFDHLLSRSGPPGPSQGAGHKSKQGISNTDVPQVLPQLYVAPASPEPLPGLHLHRVLERQGPGTSNDQEPCWTHPHLPPAGRSPSRRLPLQGGASAGGNSSPKGLCEKGTSTPVPTDHHAGHRGYSNYPGAARCKSGHPNYVEARGSRPSDNSRIQPPQASDEGGCHSPPGSRECDGQGSKKPTALQSAPPRHHILGGQPSTVPGTSGKGGAHGFPHPLSGPAYVRVSGHGTPHPCFLRQGPMEGGANYYQCPP